MSIGTFLIVYRVYYQQRRVFRSRRSGRSNQSGGSTPNKAKSLFYLLFTLNLLYFILVSPVVFATSILFRDPTAEVSYPRFKAIIYLMQYCNHSLNFIFYGSLHFTVRWKAHDLFDFRHYIASVPSDTVRLVRSVDSPSPSMLSAVGSATLENTPDATGTFVCTSTETDSS